MVRSLRKRYHMNRLSVFLTIVGLLVVTAGCYQPVSLFRTVTIFSTAGGTVTVPGEGAFPYVNGEVLNLVATPDLGYRFVNWTGDVGTIDNVYSARTIIIVNGDYSITANFAAIPSGQYSLTISSTAGGNVKTPGQGTFTYNATTVVNLEAIPNIGYRFVNWTGDVTTVANVTSASTTITINDNYSIIANFVPITPLQYSLTSRSAQGGVVTTPGEGVFTYDAGTVVNLVATPNTGYRFVNWTGDVGTIGNVYSASTTITINDNYSVTANFIRQYSLSIRSTQGGVVTTPGEGVFTYDAGTVVNLVATPDAGYRFVNWTGDVATIGNVYSASTTITMNGNYSITANFVRQYRLTIHSTQGGDVTAPGEGVFTYDAGAALTLVATPHAGYRFVNWTGNVGTVGNVYSARTIIVVNGDYSITANFAAIPSVQYSLTISSTAGGNVTAPGRGTFNYSAGTAVNLVASPNTGYRFVNWTGDVTTVANVTSASTTITMNGNYSVTANFIRQYSLTIRSTQGGTVTIPGEGVFTYDAGTGVDLVATPDAGYRFVNWTGDVDAIGNVYSASTTITMNDNYSITANFQYIRMVAAGWGHTVGLKSDGTVVAVGNDKYGQCQIDDWRDIIQVAAGGYHTVGLKSDGTVVAVGNNDYGQCKIDWRDIIQVAAGAYHTVGLKSDGTVVAVGNDKYGQCQIDDWRDIIQVAAGGYHTVGLKSNGTVVAVGNNDYGQCKIKWRDIIQVAAGAYHTVGLKSDGMVVAVGNDKYGQCQIDDWRDIIQVAAGGYHTVGLRSDGTVVAVGNNDYGQCKIDWSDIIHVAAAEYHTVGLKSDGTVVAVGNNEHGQCEVDGWTLK